VRGAEDTPWYEEAYMSTAVEPATSPTLTLRTTIALASLVWLSVVGGDLYLASLPQIQRSFGASTWITQLTLTGYFVVLGGAQLLAGPVTDRFGRRRPLLAGLGVFIGGSLICVSAPSITILISGRILEGFGAAVAMVVANSTVRDRTTGGDATRVYAVLMAIGGLGPIIAPSVGGVIDGLTGWRGVLMVVTAFGLVTSALAVVSLPETLPPQRRRAVPLGATFGAYGALFRSQSFALPLSAVAGLFVMVFGYIGGATYAYQEHWDLSPTAFGIVYGATGMAAFLGPTIAHPLSRRLSTRAHALVGVSVAICGTGIALLALVDGSLALVVVPLALGLVGLGIANPPLFSSAMSSVEDGAAGTGAAVFGAAEFVLGGVAAGIGGSLAHASVTAWLCFLVLAPLAALPGAWRTDSPAVR
jgi:DHA1 family bicyclomycin/chloramphenicol resistance-like MFS transporter